MGKGENLLMAKKSLRRSIFSLDKNILNKYLFSDITEISQLKALSFCGLKNSRRVSK